MNEPTVPSPIVDEENRVILRGELAEDVIHRIIWTETPHRAEFQALYELEDANYLGDPRERWYQGVTFTTVIRRLRDRRPFGYSYWEDISKYGDALVEPNGDDHGLEPEYDSQWNPIGGYVYVFLPVREFTITGYEVVTGGGDERPRA